jgi:hypothetical protein
MDAYRLQDVSPEAVRPKGGWESKDVLPEAARPKGGWEWRAWPQGRWGGSSKESG